MHPVRRTAPVVAEPTLYERQRQSSRRLTEAGDRPPAQESPTRVGFGQYTDNRVRPHASLGYRSLTPVTCLDPAFGRPPAGAM